jgi:predicted DNA-binding transcriptional regulator YafY
VRARGWRFHTAQEVEELPDGSLRIRFSSGGMRELAEHLFTWGGDLVIGAPDLLIATMRERLDAAESMLPDSTQIKDTTATVVASGDV